MKNKSEIAEQNEAVVKDFLAWHGSDTAKEVSQFLFERLADYANHNEGDTKEYRDSNILHFTMLRDLVTQLQPVK